MYVSKKELLSCLPPFKDKWITVRSNQQVSDIIREITKSHKDFSSHYDKICSYFIGYDIEDTCNNLYNFCKKNIQYNEESEKAQTTAVPAGILIRGYGDCKHYASFIAGCIDAIRRATGQDIKWHYCFASYKLNESTPYHVFCVVEDEDGNELYVDPTPGADNKNPVWMVNKTVNTDSMSLIKNIGSLGTTPILVDPIMNYSDPNQLGFNSPILTGGSGNSVQPGIVTPIVPISGAGSTVPPPSPSAGPANIATVANTNPGNDLMIFGAMGLGLVLLLSGKKTKKVSGNKKSGFPLLLVGGAALAFYFLSKKDSPVTLQPAPIPSGGGAMQLGPPASNILPAV